MIAKRLEQGFTLMEIMVVIVIIGVLAGFAVPQYNRAVERARAREGVQILTVLRGAQLRHHLENGQYASNLDLLDVAIPVPAYFLAPTLLAINPIAEITRSNNSYVLAIRDDGAVSCSNIVAGACTGLGF